MKRKRDKEKIESTVYNSDMFLEKLHPLPMSNTRWKILSIDFVMELLESMRFDIVMTVVNSMSKRVHFVPSYTAVMVKDIAKLFLYYMEELYGLPTRVTSRVHGILWTFTTSRKF